MKTSFSKTLAVITAFAGLIVTIWAADATFNHTGAVSIIATPSVIAKEALFITVTNGPTPVRAMTNTFRGTVVRTLQNCGTNKILYSMGGTVATTNYHGIVAGGVADEDGLGSMVDLSAWPGALTLMTVSGESKVVICELISR